MSRTQAYLYLLVALIIVVSVATFFNLMMAEAPGIGSEQNVPTPQPPITEAVKARLAASNGFQALVSYTARGFEPAKISIPKGDTIRFINNSHKNLWVAAGGGTLYPGTEDGCGSSSLDSCHALSPGEFWEFTFGVAGTWNYRNNMDTKMTGVVDVK